MCRRPPSPASRGVQYAVRSIPVLVIALLLTVHAAAAQSAVPVAAVRTGGVRAAGLVESSGVAVSRLAPGILWSHNDSGDGPFLYAIDSTGRLRAKFRVTGARAIDWEDLALAPCPPGTWPDRVCLFLADIGDNEERRARVVLYAVPEPEVAPAPRIQHTEPARALRVRYADGARDAEALVADPHGTLFIVTKGRSGPILRYAIAPESWGTDSTVVVRADTIPIHPQPLIGRWITGGAMTPDGSTVVLRTHTELYRFRVEGTRWLADGPPCWVGGLEPQGEAVDFLPDGRLILTSERAFAADGAITIVRCP